MFASWPGGQARPLPHDYEQKWTALLASRGLSRHGVWAFHDDAQPLPRQGWKIHVSAIPSNAKTVFSIVHDHALRLGFSFKVFASLQTYVAESCSMGGAYTQKGKFITIYPPNYQAFLRIVSAVGRALTGFEHYSIPFEPNIPNTPLHYRYGCITGQSNRIVSPTGETLPDDRRKYCPDFLADPLLEYIAPAPEPDHFDSVHQALSEDYSVEGVLGQRARGGNYIAVRRSDGARLFLKEGRRYSEHDAYGLTGMTRLENERYFLHRLHAAGIKVLLPLRHLVSRDYCYLVFPYLDQDDVFGLGEAEKRSIARQMIDLVQATHTAGVILGDVKLENFLFAKGQVYVADLETARDMTWEDTLSMGSRDYLPRSAELTGVRRDRYSLAISICFLFSSVGPGRRFTRGVRIRDMLQIVPAELRRIIRPWLRVSSAPRGQEQVGPMSNQSKRRAAPTFPAMLADVPRLAA